VTGAPFLRSAGDDFYVLCDSETIIKALDPQPGERIIVIHETHHHFARILHGKSSKACLLLPLRAQTGTIHVL
jgi:hypothetical protein